jgi:hypothetical protein
MMAFTLNQQMAPKYIFIWGEVEDFKPIVEGN